MSGLQYFMNCALFLGWAATAVMIAFWVSDRLSLTRITAFAAAHPAFAALILLVNRVLGGAA